MLLHEPTPGVGDRQEDPSIFSPCSPSSSFFFFSAEEGEVVEEDRVEQGLGVVAMIFPLPCFNRREHSTLVSSPLDDLCTDTWISVMIIVGGGDPI